MSESTTESPNVLSDTKKQNIEKLVIDTNAIVHGSALRHLAQEFYTCPEVLAEVRSAHSREYLERLPFELKVESPSEEAVKAVIEFSKKTGDFASLSIPDIKVLALTYTLEVQANGSDHIRKEPLQARPTGQLPSAPPPRPPKPAKVEQQQVDADGWEIATSKKNKKTAKQQSKNAKTPQKKVEQSTKEPSTSTEDTPSTEEPVAMSVEQTTLSVVTEDTPLTEEPAVTSEPSVEQITSSLENLTTSNETRETIEADLVDDDDDDDDDSDAGEWITPDNINEIKAKELGVDPAEFQESKQMAVACMTADFAMQNVLLQMNLILVSPGGYRIKKIKNWVLRCHACFTVTSNMEKKFCPKCGNASLLRVSCSTDSKGRIKYHLKHDFQYRLRGTKYDIPAPQGGRYVNNIVLREDQKEYVKAQQFRKKKTILDAFDPDFLPLSGKVGEKKNVGNNMYGTDVIGFGRKNPNVARKKRGRRK